MLSQIGQVPRRIEGPVAHEDLDRAREAGQQLGQPGHGLVDPWLIAQVDLAARDVEGAVGPADGRWADARYAECVREWVPGVVRVARHPPFSHSLRDAATRRRSLGARRCYGPPANGGRAPWW